FLGVRQGVIDTIPGDNTRPFVGDGWRTRTLAGLVRAGSRVGSAFDPRAWRRASRPSVDALHRQGRAQRPELTPDQRRLLLEHFQADLDLLEQVTGASFGDWRRASGVGAHA